jgi:cystathionine beta-lyase/cystathionine gamma-synthase
MLGFGTIISFDLLGGAEFAVNVCENVRLIRHATSLGAVESTIERRSAIPGQGHLPPSLLRLSVGIEDAWAICGLILTRQYVSLHRDTVDIVANVPKVRPRIVHQ